MNFVKVLACGCSVDFILLWKIMSVLQYLPINEEHPPNTDSPQCTTFQPHRGIFFKLKLCITNAIWLASAIVQKKVGPFCRVSRKAFKLSPHPLLPSYRNILEVLVVVLLGCEHGSHIQIFVADIFHRLMTEWVSETLSLFTVLCVCVYGKESDGLWHCKFKGFGTHTHTPQVQIKSSKLLWLKMAPVSQRFLPLLQAFCTLVTVRADKKTRGEPGAGSEIRDVLVRINKHDISHYIKKTELC